MFINYRIDENDPKEKINIMEVQNLYENEQQTAYNDVHASNQKQAEYLLNEINARFDEQNRILAKILERMERSD